MRPGTHQCRDRQVRGGLTAGRRNGPNTTLQRGDPLLEDRSGWVGNTGIDVSRALDVKE